jgi:hypothetical protein
MFLKPLQDADVRHAQGSAALQRYADSRTAWRLHGGQGGAGEGRDGNCRVLCCGGSCKQSGR